MEEKTVLVNKNDIRFTSSGVKYLLDCSIERGFTLYTFNGGRWIKGVTYDTIEQGLNQ